MPEVLQLAPNDHPPFLALCLAHARALEDAGCRVTTVFLEAPKERTHDGADPAVHYLGIAPAQRRLGSAARDLQTLCEQRRLALIICHRYKAYRLALWLRRTQPAARVIAVAHEFGYFARRRRRWYQRCFGRHVRFAGVSGAVAADLTAAHRGLRDTLVLPNAIDADGLAQRRLSRADARRALGLPAGAFVIGWVGRFHIKKRPLFAIDGFRRAIDRLPQDALLAMLGSGELESQIRQAQRAPALCERVRLLGRIDDAAAHMAAFDVLLSTGDRESFGMVLIEAMLAGTLVVSAATPGPQSVAGDAALYFPSDDVVALADRLVTVAAMPATESQHLRNAATSRVREAFSIPAIAEHYRTLLREP